MRAANCSPRRKPGVGGSQTNHRAPQGRQMFGPLAHLRRRISGARFAGSEILLRFDPRAYARGYLLPRLRRSFIFTSTVLIAAAVLSFHTSLQAQTRQSQSQEPRTRYQIYLSLDFENRTYTGTERVRWINRGDRPTSALFFHLYPNVRIPGYTAPTEKSESGQPISDEPRLEITEIRSSNDSILTFGLDDQETTLHINLRESLAPNAAAERQRSGN